MDVAAALSAERRALELYHAGAYREAEAILVTAWRNSSMRTLKGMLLMSYLLRREQRYRTQMDCLHELFERFDGTEEQRDLACAASLLGEAYRTCGQAGKATDWFCRAAELEPDRLQRLTELSNAIFSAQSMDASPAYFGTLYQRYREALSNLGVRPYQRRLYAHRKIRIGYLSADFRRHPVAAFMKALLLHYDAERFSVYVYDRNAVPDDVTYMLKRGNATWHAVSQLSFDELAAQIHEDEIDILVDLSGHTSDTSLPVFAWQPALVQISGIGYMGSTGIKETTGVLSDRVVASSLHSPYFTEPLLRLPRTLFCFQPVYAYPVPCGDSPIQASGVITFGCFNHYAKVTDDVLCAWGEILERVPGSRLFLKHAIYGCAEGREIVSKRLKTAGIDLERVSMEGFSSDYLQAYQRVDIALDTYPYTGGMTTCEALYMGCPVITWAGRRPGSAFSKSILSQVGLQGLVAGNRESYIELAVALARDKELLSLLHRNLRRKMQASPLMDAAGYCQDVEILYQRLYAR